MALTHEELLRLVRYSKTTGRFTSRVDRPNKGIEAGDEIGSISKQSGYWRISLQGRVYQAHRLAWFYVTGKWTAVHIDHRNTVRSDCRWRNLREATRKGNNQNLRTAQRNNTTGFLGVSRDRDRFRATIMFDRKRVNLGSFSTPEEAHAAYVKAKRKHHPTCTI